MALYCKKGRWEARIRTADGTRYFTGTDREKVMARAAEFDDRYKTLTPQEERFWRRVLKGSNCWLWRGYIKPDGYGSVQDENLRKWQAHRYAYELTIGPIPDGMHLDHKCRNSWCVRPAHLEPVSPTENHKRRVTRYHPQAKG